MAGDDKNKNKGADDGSTLDHNSPYYLHPSDYPRQMNKANANHMAWMGCDAMIKGWLTMAMEKDIRGSVKYANYATEIWSDLQE
uniref:Uncharacterized protein n=1 Tax=Lactuca sativa TaxID=4236 RepID=A0A9R1XW35_LACSA|nr:hypothetical protein LSAT_V11C200070840 [Lactuca sativa]